MNKLNDISKSYLNLEQNLSSVKRQYSVFFIVGVISFLFGILFLRILYRDLNYNLIAANTISFILVSGINYLLSIRYVFLRGRFNLLKEVFLFYIIAVLSLLMDNVLLFYMVEKMAVHYILSKFFTVLIVSFLTFFLKKYLVFKK